MENQKEQSWNRMEQKIENILENLNDLKGTTPQASLADLCMLLEEIKSTLDTVSDHCETLYDKFSQDSK